MRKLALILMMCFGASSAQATLVKFVDAQGNIHPYLVREIQKLFHILGLEDKLPWNTEEIAESAFSYEDMKNFRGNSYMVTPEDILKKKYDNSTLKKKYDNSTLKKKYDKSNTEKIPELHPSYKDIKDIKVTYKIDLKKANSMITINPLKDWHVISLYEFLLNVEESVGKLDVEKLVKKFITEKEYPCIKTDFLDNVYGAFCRGHSKPSYHFHKDDPSWKYIKENGIIVDILDFEEWLPLIDNLVWISRKIGEVPPLFLFGRHKSINEMKFSHYNKEVIDSYMLRFDVSDSESMGMDTFGQWFKTMFKREYNRDKMSECDEDVQIHFSEKYPEELIWGSPTINCKQGIPGNCGYWDEMIQDLYLNDAQYGEKGPLRRHEDAKSTEVLNFGYLGGELDAIFTKRYMKIENKPSVTYDIFTNTYIEIEKSGVAYHPTIALNNLNRVHSYSYYGTTPYTRSCGDISECKTPSEVSYLLESQVRYLLRSLEELKNTCADCLMGRKDLKIQDVIKMGRIKCHENTMMLMREEMLEAQKKNREERDKNLLDKAKKKEIEKIEQIEEVEEVERLSQKPTETETDLNTTKKKPKPTKAHGKYWFKNITKQPQVKKEEIGVKREEIGVKMEELAAGIEKVSLGTTKKKEPQVKMTQFLEEEKE